jgi:hypothetical protein
MFRLDACMWPSYFYVPLTGVTACDGRGFSEIREKLGRVGFGSKGFAKSVANEPALDSFPGWRYYAHNLYLVADAVIRPHILGR